MSSIPGMLENSINILLTQKKYKIPDKFHNVDSTVQILKVKEYFEFLESIIKQTSFIYSHAWKLYF